FVEKKAYTRAVDVRSHAVLPGSGVSDPGLFVRLESGERATDYVDYTSADEEVIEMLQHYDLEGDLSLLLKEENTIAVSDSAFNHTSLSLRPGDKIKLAVYTGKKYEPTYHLEGTQLLSFRLEAYRFSYVEYTVCAVLHGLPAKNNFAFFLPETDYATLTGKIDENGEPVPNPPVYSEAFLYMDPALGREELEAFQSRLLSAIREEYPASSRGRVVVKDLYASLEKELGAAGGSSGV
ncbi:MAG: hypothetical protein II797_05065, partial [Clostridia bacterium]|nr:hypothetical protein [Clostridia bacterium]